ncbi:MAG: O-antigen ligase family protein [Candidatus Liptonbacteria bacterium]|nr:O-antigen ligase family protein [Candidatus Liptonbacteria bacterium]
MLLKLTKFFTYVSLFAVLVVLTGAFFPFIGGKAYFFRIAVEVAAAFALLWWAFESAPREAGHLLRGAFRKPLVVAVSVFALAFLLAALFADNPYAAFWSNYERGEGGFQMLHYYAFFMLLALFFKEARDWERFFKVAVLAALLMVLYGAGSAVLNVSPAGAPSNPFGFVSVYVGPDGKPIAPTFLGRLFSPEVRFQGSLGNPAYVAPYLMFTMFYCFYLFSRHTKRWWWVAGGVFFFVFLILTQTRGALIGTAAAAAVFFLYAIANTEGKSRRTYTILLWALALLYGALLYYRTSEFVTSNFPVLERIFGLGLSPSQAGKLWLAAAAALLLLNVFFVAQQKMRVVAAALFLALAVGGGWYVRTLKQFPAADSFATRVWTWGTAVEGFKERPLLGWGPENFPAVFDRHFDPRHFVPGQGTETWFDRAHSVLFDYLAETGLVGLLAYLAIFITFFREFARRVRASAERVLSRALVVALPVGYLVQAFALFDVLPVYINLFLFLAFASWWLSLGAQAHHGALPA